MRNRYTTILACVLVLVGLSAAPPAQALGKVKCDVDNQPAVAIGSYDPIVNHNEDSAAHEHQFFGNTAWHDLPNPNTANYDDLVGQDNNCRPVLGLDYSADSAGYWIPTLRYVSGPRVGELVPAKQFTAYYRPAAGGKFGPAQAIPADTRLIGTKYNWTCGQNSGARSTPVQSIPDCTGLSGKPGLHPDGAHRLPFLLGRCPDRTTPRRMWATPATTPTMRTGWGRRALPGSRSV